MRIDLVDQETICVQHKNEKLFFNVHRTARKAKWIASFRPGEPDQFDIINRFLELMSEDRLNKLFMCYKRFVATNNFAKERHIRDADDRDIKFRAIVKEMFEIVSYESTYDWFVKNIKVVFPDKVHKELGENKSRDRTYIEDDYVKLAALSVAFRLVVPFLYQYIYDNHDIVGNDRKELMALKLLDTSDIIHTEPYQRFIRFIDATVETVDVKNTFKTISGIGSEEQLEISKAKKIVRRVAFIDPETKDNIIEAVFNEIFNQPTDTQRNQNRIKDKKKTGGRDEEGEPSVVEQYKIKEELPRSESALGSYYISQEYFLKDILGLEEYKRVKPKIRKLISFLIDSDYEPTRSNLMAAKFFIKGIAPESLDCVDREIQIIACVMTYALMMHKEKYNLALLALSVPYYSDDDDLSPPPTSNRATIPLALERQLDDLYPYRRKLKPTTNVVKEAIGELFKEVSGCLLIPVFSEEDKDHFKNYFTKDGYYIVPREVVVDLAEMIIFIQTNENV